MVPVEGITNVEFEDDEFLEHLNDSSHENHRNIHDILILLSVCHTILVEEKNGKNVYNASSPDELALVNAAKYFDYKFIGRDADGNVQVELGSGECIEYKLLNILEFTSTRKRMSVIVRTPKGDIVLYCKGADSIIFERLHDSSKYQEWSEACLTEFGKEGLRTLALAKRTLSEEEYLEFSGKFNKAALSLKNREDKLAAVAEEIEQELFLMGCTAIEDQLQDKVGDSIDFIKQAGIRLWVLTGDKIETAINISYSCKLISHLTYKSIIDAKNTDQVKDQLNEARHQLKLLGGKDADFALIISGEALLKCSKYDDLKAMVHYIYIYIYNIYS